MPTGYQIQDQYRPYYLTLQIVEWVDIFTRKVYRDIIVDALNYCIKNKQLAVRAGIVEHAEEYIYSSAKNYGDEKGLVQMETIDRVWKTCDNISARRAWINERSEDATLSGGGNTKSSFKNEPTGFSCELFF